MADMLGGRVAILATPPHRFVRRVAVQEVARVNSPRQSRRPGTRCGGKEGGWHDREEGGGGEEGGPRRHMTVEDRKKYTYPHNF
jgi:hypothetical protein